MKKILSIAAVALFMVIASCSGDDDTSTTTETNLIKKTVLHTGDNEQVVTNYNYDGNKIVSIITSDGTSNYYTYSGDHITEVKIYDDGDLYQTHVYTYTSDHKLATHTKYMNMQDYATRHEYTFNTDSTITVNVLTGDMESQTNSMGPYTLTMVNNNITKVTTGTEATIMTYDTGLDPMYNITGYQAINLSNNEGGRNNSVARAYQNEEGQPVTTYTIAYTYNSANYPVAAVKTDTGSGHGRHIEIFYE